MLTIPRRLRRALGPLLLSTLGWVAFAAQSPEAIPSAADNSVATLARVTALRDAFIARIRASGQSCPLAPPTIVVTHIPSFGNYDDTKNILYTADWTRLDPEEKPSSFSSPAPQPTTTPPRPPLRASRIAGSLFTN